MSVGSRTKIDWCDATWNPVTGCLHGCEYCYARRMAERFGLPYAPKLGDPGMEGAKKYDGPGGIDTMLELEKPYEKDGRKQPYPMGFLPTLHRYRLDVPSRWTRPRTIFVCSMADLFGDWVPDEWIISVFNTCRIANWHRYIFLSKNPQRYNDLIMKGLLPMENNFWYGSTRTGVDSAREHEAACLVNRFLSVEPILAPMETETLRALELWGWVIVGAETGNRKDKVIPKRDWIMEIKEQCDVCGIPIFMKESIREIMGDDFRQEFPWEVQGRDE